MAEASHLGFPYPPYFFGPLTLDLGPSAMERYASLAPYGQHRGPAAADTASHSSEVRALPSEDRRPNAAVQQQPSAQQMPPSAKSSHSRYRLLRHGGDYLLTARRSEGNPLDADVTEVGEYETVDAASGAIPTDMQFFVFENSETGAVEMRMGQDLAHGLTLDDGFDSIRAFASQDAAEAYAKGRS